MHKICNVLKQFELSDKTLFASKILFLQLTFTRQACNEASHLTFQTNKAYKYQITFVFTVENKAVKNKTHWLYESLEKRQ
ncbi:unnamed protein product [Adineta ricciae]|uniref:Uncharacterized protein n=1 Tax=Adineta ricciae TaxID=249248 RepID=A0A814X5H6_ADIRI|nr:unnamed protein product [Adineta ricciae]